MKKMQEKCKIYRIKHQLPLNPRQNKSSPSNQAMWMATPSSKLKRVAKKYKVSQCKRPYSP
jgi:hypothetical protein